MKQLSVFFLLLVINTYAQNKKVHSSDFEVYITGKATKDNRLASKTIIFKQFVKDTLLNGEPFKKYECTSFTDWKTPQSVTFVYELHNSKNYIRLDRNLASIHKVDFGIKKQDNILFGKNTSVWGSYEATEDFHYNRIFGKEYVYAFDLKKQKGWNFYGNSKGMFIQFSNRMHNIIAERNDSLFTEKMSTNGDARLHDFFNRTKQERITPKLQKGGCDTIAVQKNNLQGYFEEF